MGSARLTAHQEAVLFALGEVVLGCRAVIEAHERRQSGHYFLTENERTKIATLRITLRNLSNVEANRSAEAS
jgi:hypothetical protein